MKPTASTRTEPSSLATNVGRALRRAALVARKTARRYGTPIYYAKDGKVVALRP